MQRMHSLSGTTVALALACAVPMAFAQTPPQQPPRSGASSGTTSFHAVPARPGTPQQLPARIPKASPSSSIKGQHDLAATVESVGTGGVVKVQTGLGELAVQFPDAGQHLKKGDKIILHLSYSMDASGAGAASSAPSPIPSSAPSSAPPVSSPASAASG